MNPRQILVDVAREWVGIREASRNHFPGMGKVWDATNYPNGDDNREPYCAAFCCFVVHEGDRRSDLLRFPLPPRAAAVKGWKAWARRKDVGCVVFDPDNAVYRPEPGDIVSLLPAVSHIGIVERYDAARKIVHTIEANTDGSGGREGDGIYRRERKLGACGEFYRLPARALR